MRSTWLIEPVFAEAHIPYINAYLAGQLPQQLSSDEKETDDDEPDPLARVGYALAPTAGAESAPQTRYSLSDPELPDNSVFVIDIRGAIFKESTCCSTGTEDYCKLINQAYASEKIIGLVALIDSPGGQLSGTPTLFDALRNPIKPTVSVINEGLMASAAYWLACGSDDIYATQKSDQVGSIGVFVQFEDRTKAREAAGVKLVTVYSDRSTQKNKPFRDALAGDDSLLREDLNQAADLFREAVEQGRGARLKNGKKGTADDVFEGGLFYASKALELGLIDGFGDLTTAINRVTELHNARQQSSAPGSSTGAVPARQTTENLTPTLASADAPELGAITPESPTPVAEAPSQSPTQNPTNPMFGFKSMIASLAAVHGIAAAEITDAQITAINADFAAQGYNLAVVSQSQFSAAQALETQLATANSELVTANANITTLTGTIATQTEEITRLGKQPGTMGTKTPKEEETLTPEGEAVISETDAELARLKGKTIK